MRLPELGRVMTRGRRLIPQVDGLRFVAISTVVLFHVAHWLPGHTAVESAPGLGARMLMKTGYYGVQLFFVISGFLLATPFFRQRLADGPPVPLSAYYWRRLTRLEPPYILILVAVFLVYAWIEPGPFTLWPHLFASLVYQHGNVFGEMNPLLGASWSLETEIQFYVLTPLLTRAFTFKSRPLRRVLLILAILCFSTLSARITGPRWSWSVVGQLHNFLAGYLFADVYVTDWREAPTVAARWDVLSAVGWPLLALLLVARPWTDPVLPFVVFALYCGAFRGPISRRILGQPWIVMIGGMCYTVYLLHGPIIRVVCQLMRPWIPALHFEAAFAIYAVSCCAVTLMVSTAFFVLIERPCMDPSWPSLFVARLRRAWPSSVEPS